MNSIKTKSTSYSLVNGKAVGGVVIEPIVTGWMVYVAWEWPAPASDGFFAIVGAAVENTAFSMNELINHVADYGRDVTHIEEIRALFPQLFKN